MRYTTVGSGTIALTWNRVRASHLVENGEVRLLLDCGSGATQRLAALDLPWTTITHVALTHFHIDHHGDLPTLVFAWKYGILPGRTAPLTIIGPVGTVALIERLAAAYGEWLLAPGFPLEIREIDAGETIDLGGLSLGAFKVPHSVESVAYSVTANGRRIVYSGDTGYDEAFATWAAGCDLLVLECSLPAAMAIPEHLTPEQCGALADIAKAQQLALTHFYPPVEEYDIRALVNERFQGPVVLTHDGWQIDIEDE